MDIRTHTQGKETIKEFTMNNITLTRYFNESGKVYKRIILNKRNKRKEETIFIN